MRKALKIILIILLIPTVLALTAICAYFIITKDAVLDESKLTDYSQNITILDENGEEISSTSVGGKNKSVKIENLKQQTIDAFIASEDRTFFKHNGLNYKRMLKALYKNITSSSYKEGASTISQQLIKNTHLSNDKTLRRKLNEIRLTRQLEKRYSKNSILEMYLNTIYFGHSCYGLKSAAEFYFDVEPENLSLTQSATIVGLLTSPNNYSPFKNPEKSLKRRNLVLKSMLDCKYISQESYNGAVNEPITVKQRSSRGTFDDYLSAVFDELDETGTDFYSLANCKIKTYLNKDLQKFIESRKADCDCSFIVEDNKTGGVSAYFSTLGEVKRQPGSTIKPILVYAPAIEEKQISPYTKIEDEKIDFNGYSPENYDKKYHGYVSVEDSIKQSYNVPAVKTLNGLTLDKAEKYATKMNIKLDEDEKNLSLALGGMKYGLTLKELADRYAIFPNGGNYVKSHFIKEIVSPKGKTLYSAEQVKNNVFSEGTCSLINEMLINTSKTGTARALQEINFDVAAKTGTCGNSEGNTDAYAMGYTSRHTFGVWLGDGENKRLNITGGGKPCKILKQIIEQVYKNSSPERLEINAGTTEIEIDLEEYVKNNRAIICDDASPKYNVKKVKVLQGNEPKEISTKFSRPQIQQPEILVENNRVKIVLCQTKYYSYVVNRLKNNKKTEIYNGLWKENIFDAPEEGVYVYTVTPYYKSGDKIYYGEEITLPQINLNKNSDSPQVKIPDIAGKDWFNL